MNEPVNPINNTIISATYQTLQNRSQVIAGSDGLKNNKQTSSKYIIDDHQIVYEQYDRYGKLISRVPWTANPISEKACSATFIIRSKYI
jgi:hypothetical protein